MKIYDDNGFIDIPAIANYMRQNDLYFCLLWGARGTGKTYGEFKEGLIEHPDDQFIYLRRQKTQTAMLATNEFNPVNPINDDFGTAYVIDSVARDIYGFYESVVSDDGVVKPVGEPHGLMLSLSQISGMRGFDASKVKTIFFDEFIPEEHEKPIRNEAAAFFNAYETITRNRELKGQKAPICILTANSNTLTSPIFVALKVVTKALEIEKDPNKEMSILKDRGIMLISGKNSPISKKKRDTALYRAVGSGSDFTDMALENKFIGVDESNVRPRKLVEFKPVVTVGELTIYKHKSDQRFYCTTHRSGNPAFYDVKKNDLMRFKKTYSYLWSAFIANRIEFEAYECKVLFEEYFK